MAVRTWFPALVALALAGCRPAGPGGVGPAPTEEPDAPMGEAIADPVLREAREQADATLTGLLAGKFDHDTWGMSGVAREAKGYQSYAIKSQKVVRDGAAEFGGLLTGPKGRARFGMVLVKQSGVGWAVVAFLGPDPK